jgi:hypothetical protein
VGAGTDVVFSGADVGSGLRNGSAGIEHPANARANMINSIERCHTIDIEYFIGVSHISRLEPTIL